MNTKTKILIMGVLAYIQFCHPQLRYYMSISIVHYLRETIIYMMDDYENEIY